MNFYPRSYIDEIGTALIVTVTLALIGGIILHFTFLSPKNENKFNGFLGWLYNFLSFKQLMLETLLKILYLIITIAIALFGFYMLFQSFGTGLAIIIGGLVFIRILYESSLLMVLICKNTIEINRKLGGSTNHFTQNSQTPNLDLNRQPPINNPDIHVQQQSNPPVQSISENFCPSCNHKNAKGSKFCKKCGTTLG